MIHHKQRRIKMKTTIKTLGLSTAVAAMLISTSANAGSIGGFGGALEVTQDAQWAADIGDRAISYSKQMQQYATQVMQYEQQIQQYVNQFQSYKMMLQNIGQLPQAQWRQFQNSVMQLKHAVEFGQSISYTAANFDQKFQQVFKGYDNFLTQNGATAESFQAAYKKMYQSTRDTVRGALKSLKLQEQDLQNDEQVMAALQQQSQSAVGQLSAVQAANQIALHQTTQMKKLQKTIMTQANMQAEFIAAQNQEDQMGRASVESFASEPTDTHSDDRSPIRYQR
jgi:P-type conjugative transfer protein TrbJ